MWCRRIAFRSKDAQSTRFSYTASIPHLPASRRVVLLSCCERGRQPNTHPFVPIAYTPSDTVETEYSKGSSTDCELLLCHRTISDAICVRVPKYSVGDGILIGLFYHDMRTKWHATKKLNMAITLTMTQVPVPLIRKGKDIIRALCW